MKDNVSQHVLAKVIKEIAKRNSKKIFPLLSFCIYFGRPTSFPFFLIAIKMSMGERVIFVKVDISVYVLVCGGLRVCICKIPAVAKYVERLFIVLEN